MVGINFLNHGGMTSDGQVFTKIANDRQTLEMV